MEIQSVIDKTNQEKDLGVFVDDKLNFSTHVQKTASKANQITGIIYRSFTYMSPAIFTTLYKALIRPHLEYASTTWSPLYVKDKISIEGVQRRATKRIPTLEGKTYTERLKILGLPTLEYRRERADMIQVYKIINNIDILDRDNLFTQNPYVSTRGHSKKLYKRPFRKQLTAKFLQ
ncbi:uncharacterized protein B0403.1-like [Argopecten irradians]|uniref:uncharacterized protein B0403.1-like n=1 Tax=Argopecten irradians TaxID=31199 RepID=UPI00371DD4EF